jgi:signal transduction histidine kinase
MANDENLSYLSPSLLPAEEMFTDAERSALSAVNAKVAAGESLKEIIDFIFGKTRDLMPCDRIGVGFLEEDGRRLSLHHVTASYTPVLLHAGYSSDVQGSSLEQIFGSGEPRIINDLELYLAGHPDSESTRLLVAEGVRSNMTCPLIVESRFVGLLFRSSRNAGAYGPREVALHMAMAERLGQAVEKAWRYEQLSTSFNSYMEMLGFVTHELKSPLSSIIMLGRTLTDGYFGEIEEKHREIVERMVKKAEYLMGISNEYLNLSRFESGKMSASMKEADMLRDIIDPSEEIIRPQMDANRVRYERSIEGDPRTFRCDPDLVKIAVVNLLGNAVKYGNVKGAVRLKLAFGSARVTVSVWNEGPGFPESEKRFLFRKFSRLHTKELEGRKGTGVGLYMSWRIVNLHGGRMWADSEEGKWAEFSFELPFPAAE